MGWIQRDSGLNRELTEAVDWAAECGELLVYHDWGDGGIMVAVYLDEEPEKRFQDRWKLHIRGGILNVPSGRLICQALEDTGSAEEADFDSGAGRDVARIPPDRYFLDAYQIHWREDEHAELIDREFGYENTRDFDREAEGGGCAFGAIPALALAGLGMWQTGSEWREPLAVVCLILCGVMAWWLKHSWFVPVNSALAASRREAELRWPSVFVVLAPVVEGPFAGWPVDLKMGPGFDDTEFLEKERCEPRKKEPLDEPVGDGKVKSWRWVRWEAIAGIVAGMAGSGCVLVLAAVAQWLNLRTESADSMGDYGDAIASVACILFLLFPMVCAIISARREIGRQRAWEN